MATRGYYPVALGGGGGDPPTLDNPFPANEDDIAATRAAARYTPVAFDVLNPDQMPYVLWVKFRNDDRGFVVYDSVVGFLPPFTGLWTAGATPADPGRLTVFEDGGWQDAIEWLGLGGGADPSIIVVRAGMYGSDNPPDAP